MVGKYLTKFFTFSPDYDSFHFALLTFSDSEEKQDCRLVMDLYTSLLFLRKSVTRLFENLKMSLYTLTDILWSK